MARETGTSRDADSALSLVRAVCDIAGSRSLIDDARTELAAAGVIEAIRHHNNTVIFDWLMNAVSYQGISDAAATTFIEDHERISAKDIDKALRRKPSCPKLAGYHRFYGCGYRKWKNSCAEPEHKPLCPLPWHDLRNGRLNRTAYALYMFMRDVAAGDFVEWVDYQLRAGTPHDLGLPHLSGGPLIGPMSHIEGIGPKVLSMSMASFLLAGDAERPHWIEAGAQMIAVDSLVHAWLHRTGILKALAAVHQYGEACYRERGCAQVIEGLARDIDARHYSRSYPRFFPRFVQFAIWRFCAQEELNVCNGNKIDDSRRCNQRQCQLYKDCGRIRLHQKQRHALTQT